MSKIIQVEFQSAITLGGIPTTQWRDAKPGVTALAGKITARWGDPAKRKEERPGSIVFECRVPGDHYDLIVPEGNIAGINVIDEPAQATSKAVAK